MAMPAPIPTLECSRLRFAHARTPSTPSLRELSALRVIDGRGVGMGGRRVGGRFRARWGAQVRTAGCYRGSPGWLLVRPVGALVAKNSIAPPPHLSKV